MGLVGVHVAMVNHAGNHQLVYLLTMANGIALLLGPGTTTILIL